MIEKEIFKWRRIRFDKLSNFGFRSEGGRYLYEREILSGMVARVIIYPNGEVVGKVIDTEVGEEYVNHRIEGVEGAYVVGVRNAYEAFLTEIADAVCDKTLYVSDQANRIGEVIQAEYGVSPEFLWKRFPHYGVYRNPDTCKWFAIIMNISRKKLGAEGAGEADVMNVKLDEKCESYLQKGAIPCYHMNQKNWVTVPLDDSLSDDLVREMIAISYENAKKKGKR